MPKGRKRYKRKDNSDAPGNTGYFGKREKRERPQDETREYLKLFLFMVTWIIFLTGVYMVSNQLEFWPIFPVYAGLGLALFIVWLIYNGGFKKIDTEQLEKPEDVSYEEFVAFTDNIKARQKRAKYFLILFIPFPMIMLVHGVILDWAERLS